MSEWNYCRSHQRKKWTQQDVFNAERTYCLRHQFIHPNPLGLWRLMVETDEKRESIQSCAVQLETLSSRALQELSTISYLCRDTDIGVPQTRISHESPGMKDSGSMVYCCPIQFPWSEVRVETACEYWNPSKCFQHPSPFIDGHAHTWLKCFCND